MKAWWHHFSNALSQTECEWLIKYAKSFDELTATVGRGGKCVVDETIRRSNVRWLGRTDPNLDLLFRKIENMALKANAISFGFDISGFHEVQFTTYKAENEGTYGFHEDNNWKSDAPFDRKISMSIQLSDPDSYTGGRLVFKNDKLPDHIFRNQGDAIFFPSFNRHTVTPVKLGTRHSLVTWFVGPKFR